MNNEEQYLLSHAERWLPFGGPDEEEAMVEFGITRSAYLRRVCEVSQRSDDIAWMDVRSQIVSLHHEENRPDGRPNTAVHRQ